MLEFLKKIGIPATAAAVITAIVTVVPFLWKIDERYAKQEQLEEEVKKLEAQNHELSKELAQSVGFQQAMIALIQQGKVPVSVPVPSPVRIESRIESRAPASAPPAPAAAPLPAAEAPAAAPPPKAVVQTDKAKNWNEIGEGLNTQQRRLQQRN
jgi:hypothetical protein